jgi:hypothetical protein
VEVAICKLSPGKGSCAQHRAKISPRTVHMSTDMEYTGLMVAAFKEHASPHHIQASGWSAGPLPPKSYLDCLGCKEGNGSIGPLQCVA